MDARSAQFQQQLQEKDDEIKRLWEQLRVRIQKRLFSAQTHVYSSLVWLLTV